MKLKHAVPGLVWMAVGGGIYAYTEATHTPLVIRGTTVNWGLAVVATGVVIAIIGMIRNRKQL